jgi:hypothetical protein
MAVFHEDAFAIPKRIFPAEVEERTMRFSPSLRGDSPSVKVQEVKEASLAKKQARSPVNVLFENSVMGGL